ncbi:MAG: dihydrofolate reductase family protein, partial [Acidobacteriota bacterium]
MALRGGGERARGGSLYVNCLPTAESLRSAGGGEIPVRQVVACHGDPATPGAAAGLGEAGLEVSCGDLARRAVELNWRYLAWRTFARPAVTLKWAMSLDDRIATVAGDSQWISSPDGRRWALEQREVHDAIL